MELTDDEKVGQFRKDSIYADLHRDKLTCSWYGRQTSKVVQVLLFHRHKENASLISKNRSRTFFSEV